MRIDIHIHEERLANARADDECPDSEGDYAATPDGYGGGCEIPHHRHAGGAHHGDDRAHVRVAVQQHSQRLGFLFTRCSRLLHSGVLLLVAG